MKLALELIDDADTNIRETPPPEASELAMQASMKWLGQLVPITVRMRDDGQRYKCLYGSRRLRAARALGWQEIEAVVSDLDGPDLIAAQAGENMVRTPMHPVDEWLAVREMVKAGMHLNQAAMSLGLTERQASQYKKLADLDPEIITALRKYGIPGTRDLALIASAPGDVQRKALKGAVTGQGINWHQVSAKCQVKRISQLVAIFDVKKSGVPFDHDLFAQPGSADEFTTTEIEAFMACQEAALKVKVDKAVKKGFHVRLVRWDPKANYGTGEPVIPKGYVRSYDTRTRPKGDDTRIVLTYVKTSGHGIGSVEELVVEKTRAKEKPGKSKGASVKADPAGDSVPAPPRVLTNLGLDLVARAKTQAVHERLRADAEEMEAATMLRLLLLSLCSLNVTVTGESGRVDIRRDVSPLVGNNGQLVYDVNGPDPRVVAANVLEKIITFGGPKTRFGASGPAAEIIGHAISAEKKLARFDTPEFLETVSVATLKELAASANVAAPKKTATALRPVLQGNLADWRPEEAMFKPEPLVSARQASEDLDDGDEEQHVDPQEGGSEDAELEAAE